jgi:BolA protein
MCHRLLSWQQAKTTDQDIATMTTRAQRMERIFTDVFRPARLEMEDESARHAGHKERNNLGEGGETHFRVSMVAASFAGMSRVARSRAVHEALAAEFASGLHALTLTLRTPAETTG